MVGYGVDHLAVAQDVGRVPSGEDPPLTVGEGEGGSVFGEGVVEGAFLVARAFEEVAGRGGSEEEDEEGSGGWVEGGDGGEVGEEVGGARDVVGVFGFEFPEGGAAGRVGEVDGGAGTEGVPVEVHARGPILAPHEDTGGPHKGGVGEVLGVARVLPDNHEGGGGSGGKGVGKVDGGDARVVEAGGGVEGAEGAGAVGGELRQGDHRARAFFLRLRRLRTRSA